MFADRLDAGRQLAMRLLRFAGTGAVVLALPRGGVPVASEVARALGAPLDLLLVRKLGVPGHPELAMGAVVDGERVEIVPNEDVLQLVGAGEAELRAAAERELAELERRRALYCGERAPEPLAGRTAIVVDDGIATGATMRAALQALRRRSPARVVLAVPVAPPAVLADLAEEADEIECLESPASFGAVGEFYRDFRQTTDAEVLALLGRPPEQRAASPRGDAA